MEDQVRACAQEIDEAGEFPEWVADLFRETGLFAAAVPEEYGGIDGKLVTLCLVCEEIGRVSPSCSMILGVQALGSGPIVLFGSPEQKQRWLSPLATGERLVAFGLTEPDAGSDVRSMRTRATAEEGGWRLNGRKCFISHANVADQLVVFAKVERDGKDEITAFVLETDQPGFTVDKVEHKMGLRGSPTCSLVLEDAWVPQENLLGQVGQGMEVLLETLHRSRIHSAAQGLGLGQGALDLALAYCRERKQFGRHLSKIQVVQSIVGRIATSLEAARCLVYTAAGKADAGGPGLARYSAMAKLAASDSVMDLTTNAVQIMGGYGYCVDYGVERYMRDAKVFQIFEGANQLHETAIGRSLFAGI
jgi:alkylation response protein AidB-like acyl-CoA dehydrogenase